VNTHTGIQLGINWSRAMICQRQRDLVRTFNGEDEYNNIQDKVSTFMTKVTGTKEFDYMNPNSITVFYPQS
jgi:hypothetical protein